MKDRKSLFLIIIIIIAALAVGFIIGIKFDLMKNIKRGGVACTEEAKICPDGSAVGRTGPNCEFAPCPSK